MQVCKILAIFIVSYMCPLVDRGSFMLFQTSFPKDSSFTYCPGLLDSLAAPLDALEDTSVSQGIWSPQSPQIEIDTEVSSRFQPICFQLRSKMIDVDEDARDAYALQQEGDLTLMQGSDTLCAQCITVSEVLHSERG